MSNRVAVVFEDEDYVIFNKPSGLLTIPTKDQTRCLTEVVNQEFAAKADFQLHPCHRLDRDTSGLIIYAKGKRKQQKMMAAFREKSVTKHYIAFVQGHLDKPRGEFRKSIIKTGQEKFNRLKSGQPAVTKYRVLKKLKNFSMLDVEPVTGRRNQIRIHFAQAGHPLLGERKFAFAKDYALKFRRVALHAAQIQFVQPFTGENIDVSCPLPDDMENFLKKE